MEALMNPVTLLIAGLIILVCAIALVHINLKRQEAWVRATTNLDKPDPLGRYKGNRYQAILEDLENAFAALASARYRVGVSDLLGREYMADQINRMMADITDATYTLMDPDHELIRVPNKLPIEPDPKQEKGDNINEYPTHIRHTEHPSDLELLRRLTKDLGQRDTPNAYQY